MRAMRDTDYLGKQATDIPTEKLEELLKKGYSVSPESGRIRKRLKKKKKKEAFSKRKLNKTVQKIGWIILLILFIVSVVMMIPYMGENRDKNKYNKTR
jgi:hypothetical protein